MILISLPLLCVFWFLLMVQWYNGTMVQFLNRIFHFWFWYNGIMANLTLHSVFIVFAWRWNNLTKEGAGVQGIGTYKLAYIGTIALSTAKVWKDLFHRQGFFSVFVSNWWRDVFQIWRRGGFSIKKEWRASQLAIPKNHII